MIMWHTVNLGRSRSRGILACDVLTHEGEHDRIFPFTPALEPTFPFWKLQRRNAHARHLRIFSVNKTIQRSDFATVTTFLWCSKNILKILLRQTSKNYGGGGAGTEYIDRGIGDTYEKEVSAAEIAVSEGSWG